MICLICGKKDCNHPHRRGNELPDELFFAVFGKKKEYNEDLKSLNAPELSAVRPRWVHGVRFYDGGWDIKALFQGKKYDVSVIDPRLLSKGVRFFNNGQEVVPRAGGTSVSDCWQEHVRNDERVKPRVPDNTSANHETKPVILYEDEIAERHVISRCSRLFDDGKLDANVIPALYEYLSSKWHEGIKADELKLIYRFYSEHIFLPDTAFLLLLSYFPHAADSGYAVPVVLDSSNKTAKFIKKTWEELHGYMQMGANDLYPKICFRRQFLDLIKPLPDGRRFLHIIAWNIFHITNHDQLFKAKVDLYIKRLSNHWEEKI